MSPSTSVKIAGADLKFLDLIFPPWPENFAGMWTEANRGDRPGGNEGEVKTEVKFR